MRILLIGGLLLFRLMMSAETPCALKIGNMLFAQPNGAAEAFIGSTGDTTWRIRYEIGKSGKEALFQSIFGAMHFQCDNGTTKVRSFTMTAQGENFQTPYIQAFKTNYIVRDEILEYMFEGKSFTLYIDDIDTFASGSEIYGLAIEYKE